MNDSASVLLVEDNPINQKVVTAILKRENLSSDLAENGQEALDLCERRHQPYDLIFMDLEMPVMDGIEATRRIKANPAFGNPRIVILSAHTREAQIEAGLEAGAYAFQPKPFKVSELRAFLPSKVNS